MTAEVVGMERQDVKDGIDNAWWNEVRDIPIDQLRTEHDKGWRWHKDIGTLRAEAGNLGYGWVIRTDDRIQGAILYRIGAVSELDPSQATLMVYRLATAPWNRAWLRSPREYAKVGTGLLRLAAYHSLRYGLRGRVTAEVYPDDPLLEWYAQRGFQLATRSEDGIHVLE
jgi:hypothetical protein